MSFSALIGIMAWATVTVGADVAPASHKYAIVPALHTFYPRSDGPGL